MTLHPRYIPDVPEQTAFRKGNSSMQMRDELGTLFSDEQFTDLFPNVGRVGRIRVGIDTTTGAEVRAHTHVRDRHTQMLSF